MTQLIATTVIRGSSQGESHGGIFLANLESGQLLHPVDWNTADIDWRGHGRERGLRGIAFHGDHIYIAASNELLVFDQTFKPVASYCNPYLKNCHEICVFGHHLFAASTGCDSILGFNLDEKIFDFAFKVGYDGMVFSARRYDPGTDDGPLLVSKLHINNVFCDKGGMYVSGHRTSALLKFGGKSIGVATTLPEAANNARPFRDGVLFIDTAASAVRFERPDAGVALPVARPIAVSPDGEASRDDAVARQGYGRGLCVIGEDAIAVGSSPATITVYDLSVPEATAACNLSLDARTAIHSIAVWPHAWPGT